MADYSHLSALAITSETTREYTFDLIPGEPSIILAPAHDSNEAFQNERLRYQIDEAERLQAAPRGKKAPKLTVDTLKKGIEDDRERDRYLIAHACARSWGTPPKDKDGKEPEFSAEECYAFLKAMPDFMLDPFRNFAGNLYNFVDRPEVSSGGAEALGNS